MINILSSAKWTCVSVHHRSAIVRVLQRMLTSVNVTAFPLTIGGKMPVANWTLFTIGRMKLHIVREARSNTMATNATISGKHRRLPLCWTNSLYQKQSYMRIRAERLHLYSKRALDPYFLNFNIKFPSPI
jgi:hypothetical protein